MKRKKIFFDKDSKKARKKTLNELKKKNIEIEDETEITGGNPQWLESGFDEDDGNFIYGPKS